MHYKIVNLKLVFIQYSNFLWVEEVAVWSDNIPSTTNYILRVCGCRRNSMQESSYYGLNITFKIRSLLLVSVQHYNVLDTH